MKVLELFCGTKSISNVFEKRGHETFTVDFDAKFKPDLCIDILKFDIDMLPKEWRKPDVIWASPPCQTFSVASIYHYWVNGQPKTWKTYIGLAIVKKTIELIMQLEPKFYFIENPTAMLRKQSFMQSLHRKTLTYCQYGLISRKSTDIWTNAYHWIPKKPCKAGDKCHDEARRGIKTGIKTGIQGTGVQNISIMGTGLTRAQARAIIPKKLCEEIVDICENKLTIKQTKLGDK